MKKKVHLIGIKGKAYQHLLVQLGGMFSKMEKEIEINEVVSVDEILTYNLKAIPAIVMNDQVIFQQNGKVLTVSELEELLISHL